MPSRSEVASICICRTGQRSHSMSLSDPSGDESIHGEFALIQLPSAGLARSSQLIALLVAMETASPPWVNWNANINDSCHWFYRLAKIQTQVFECFCCWNDDCSNLIGFKLIGSFGFIHIDFGNGWFDHYWNVIRQDVIRSGCCSCADRNFWDDADADKCCGRIVRSLFQVIASGAEHSLGLLIGIHKDSLRFLSNILSPRRCLLNSEDIESKLTLWTLWILKLKPVDRSRGADASAGWVPHPHKSVPLTTLKTLLFHPLPSLVVVAAAAVVVVAAAAAAAAAVS